MLKINNRSKINIHFHTEIIPVSHSSLRNVVSILCTSDTNLNSIQ